jgi:hypothetical protein
MQARMSQQSHRERQIADFKAEKAWMQIIAWIELQISEDIIKNISQTY